MPGLPEPGGEFFVYSKTRPAGATGLTIDGASQRTFSAATGHDDHRDERGGSVHYTLLTPGAVIDQGELPVVGGKFSLRRSTRPPSTPRCRSTTSSASRPGKPQIGRVIHLTFFSEERPGGHLLRRRARDPERHDGHHREGLRSSGGERRQSWTSCPADRCRPGCHSFQRGAKPRIRPERERRDPRGGPWDRPAGARGTHGARRGTRNSARGRR